MVPKLVRPVLGALAVLGAVAGDAVRAGDAAQVQVIGFSPDGKYVAIEQYGMQDGSGWPYADIFVIDLAADDWVDGTPVSVMLKDDMAMPPQARAAAMKEAAAVLERVGIDGSVRGMPLLRHELTDGSIDPHGASFRMFWNAPLTYELKLTEREIAAPADCPEDFAPFKLYDLVLVYPDGRQRVLHQDKTLPKSRGCPMGYGIAEVWHFKPAYDAPEGTEPAELILLHMQQPGFEGPNVRFLAIGLSPSDLEPF
jgi:predicted secreted protein